MFVLQAILPGGDHIQWQKGYENQGGELGWRGTGNYVGGIIVFPVVDAVNKKVNFIDCQSANQIIETDNHWSLNSLKKCNRSYWWIINIFFFTIEKKFCSETTYEHT